MAQVTNNFLKGKMNKDLDARLLQPGEYRNAVNAQVSKSEGSNVGSLENVLGNTLVYDWNAQLGVTGLKSIGYLTDEINNTMYLFLTDNQQDGYDIDAKNYIVSYNSLTQNSAVLVEGAFLNFSQLNPIYGVNILEGLLFFTDNRNQPRKINVTNPLGYYTTEDQISVAKYNPYQAIEFWRNTGVVDEYETTMKDVSSKFYPNGGEGTGEWNAGVIITIDITTLNGNIPVGGRVGYLNETTGALVKIPACRVVSVDLSNYNVTVNSNTIPAPPLTPTNAITWVFSYNPYYENNFSGDSEFLKDRFARFSYRFQFDDNEYSIFAPFTQPMFIPEQDGYFMRNTDTGSNTVNVEDEEDTYRSTIVDFMENKVTKTELRIPLPFNKSTIGNDLNITSVDILYKESDALSVKIVDSIPISTISAQTGDAKVFTYDYNSKKPYKTLPSDEITRVFDKTPVKALAQEVSANRIIYGNFQTKHTPPKTINYNVRVAEKTFEIIPVTAVVGVASTGTTITISAQTGIINVGDEYVQNVVRTNPTVVSVSANTIVLNGAVSVTLGQTITFTGSELLNPSNTVSKIEYPSSSLKQNRTYQVGVVLSDRFGRQSTVVLSELDSTVAISNQDYLGSTVFSEYLNSDVLQGSFPGHALSVLFNSPISPSTPNSSTGWPGVYNGDTTSKYYNPLGWFSYKIVVKQQEQEYYNVYLPGVMAAYPEDSSLEIGKTSHTVLINDNINKVPRDLSEVGPTQKQFRSSVQLYGRVENQNSSFPYLWNKPYYPSKKGSIVSTIAGNNDLFNGDNVTEYIPSQEFYNVDSDPLIARISTIKQFGVIEENLTTTLTSAAADTDTLAINTLSGLQIGDRINGIGVLAGTVIVEVISSVSIKINKKQTLANTTELTFFSSNPIENVQRLAIFETEPVLSELDIFWESTTSGLISDLNTVIIQDSSSASNLNGFNSSNFTEAIIPGVSNSGVSPLIGTSSFELVDNFGQSISYTVGTLELVSVEDFLQNDRSNEFTFNDPGTGFYTISVDGDATHPYYVFSAPTEEVQFRFTFRSTTVVGNTTNDFTEEVTLENVIPTILETCPQTITITNDNGQAYGTVATLHGINGSAYGANKTNGLEWELINQPVSDGQVYFLMSSPVDVLNYPTAGNTASKVIITANPNVIGGIPNRVYGLKVVLRDAGNASLQCQINVTVENTVCNAYTAPTPDVPEGFWAFQNSPPSITITYTNCDNGDTETNTGSALNPFVADGVGTLTQCSAGPPTWSIDPTDIIGGYTPLTGQMTIDVNGDCEGGGGNNPIINP
tara:strand:- start:3495 stop:7388 length:3894 start_codon:yes stop_codon:yes gene_type:complete